MTDKKKTYFPEREALKPYYKQDYNEFWHVYIDTQNKDDKMHLIRAILRHDLFFLLYYGFGRKDINDYDKPFIIQACKEVEKGPKTDTVDLWSRGSYKSTILTQAWSLQEVLRDFETSIGIFSHTRPIAKDFLLPIKTAMERNVVLRQAFPDLIWENPRRDAPVWSMDSGLELNRKATSNTHSFEAWGLVDGMPTGKHFTIRVYDDVVTDKVVLTPEQMQKAEQQFRLSDNLSADNGWQRVVGTNYHFGDFYQILTEEAAKGIYPYVIRRKPWYSKTERLTEEELLDVPTEYQLLFGNKKPVLYTTQQILDKYKKQGPYIFACQLELNPANEVNAEFKTDWIKYYRALPVYRTRFMLVDPANEKKPESDYTVVVVISIDAQGNKYLEDMVRDKLNLGERWKTIKKMFEAHAPIAGCWYEKYGKDSDIWYFEQQMMQEGTYFTVWPMGGRTAKKDRIRRLIPTFANQKFFLPQMGIWYQGRNLVDEFIDEEYRTFPFCKTYDMLDVISRIEDPDVAAYGPAYAGMDYSLKQQRHIEKYAIEGI